MRSVGLIGHRTKFLVLPLVHNPTLTERECYWIGRAENVDIYIIYIITYSQCVQIGIEDAQRDV